MRERVVVSFRGAAPAKTSASQTHLDRALALKEHADALGASLCAWSATTFSFDFDPDELEEAITLALHAAEEDVGPDERFGVGIAEGKLAAIGDGSLAMLGWGPPLVAAVSLCNIADPGDVLLDPDMRAVRSNELMTCGSRLATSWGTRVRGLRLDVVEPWRAEAVKNVRRIAEPQLVGCEGVFEQLDVPLGSLGAVRAEAGAGGSRLLAEWIDRLGPPRVLLIAPVGASREPLGAVRCALSRSAAIHGAPALPEALRGVLDRLLAGEGAELSSVASLLAAWLDSTEESSGVLAIDDANDIDPLSQEAAASAIASRRPFRMIVRVDVNEPLPVPFQSIPEGPALVIGPLARENAEHLGAGFMRGGISEDALVRWARRGSVSPLAIREALAEGLTSGELSWAGDIAVPRKRSAGRGRTAGAHEWIARRVRRIAPEERVLLTTLAILGGDASDVMLDELARAMGGAGTSIASAADGLAAAGWIFRPEPGWTKLKSRTARDTLIGLIDPPARRKWHDLAAKTIAQHAGALGLADAAWHAAQAGDARAAATFAMDAASAATAASMNVAAATLVLFARAEDPGVVEKHEADQDAPPPATRPSLIASAASPVDEIEELEDLEIDLDPMDLAYDLEEISIDHASEPADSNALTKESPSLGPTKLLELAKEALVQGDITTLEALLVELRLSGDHRELVDRMGSFVALGRGSKSEALRKLQAASLQSDLPPAKRARALLAYGVALAASGRTESALLEALDALAQARTAADRHGQHACTRFLARLSRAAGDDDAAQIWAEQARLSADASVS